ncbi:MAG: GIY-YIG nuclease family protein [Desulfamplus sp.]|nr:GIY-YIG nuclease family protein [Desulfamplus sp.]
MNRLKDLKPFYVYALLDNADKSIFYIGKGQDARLFQHVKEVARGIADNEKQLKILGIKKNGREVKELVIGRFDTEQEAFAVECTLIHWVYGIENLTNSASGHGSNLIRPKNNYSIIPTLEKSESHQYYVYALTTDSNNCPFYIGQGKDNRAFQHEKEVIRGNTITRKQKKISDNIVSGRKVKPLIIGRFKTKDEALAVESLLIHWVYGINSLTNDVSGHGVVTIRPKDHYEELQGIDEPELNYCQRTKANRERNNVIEFLNEIKELIESDCNITFDEINTQNDRHTYLVKFIKGVILAVVSHHTPRRAAAVTIQSIDLKKESKERVRYICDRTKLEWKDNGRYGRIMPAGSYTDQYIVLQKFKETLFELEKVKI